jgi:rRNA maturation endonuclease Nob1
MNTSFAGTATRNTLYLPVSDQRSKTFLTLRNIMTSFDPNEIKRIKGHPVKCPRCKLTVLVKPGDEVCPVCGSKLPKPEKR